MCTGVTSNAGDSLEISVCAEMYQTGGTVFFRALVDGVVASPTDVAFKQGNVGFDGSRSFTFIKENVSAGQHIVEIEWMTGSAAAIRDRVLTVVSGQAAAGHVRLATAVAPSGPLIERTSSTWADIPDLATTIVVNDTVTMAIAFSAEAYASSGKMMVRAVINGSTSNEITFCQSGDPERSGTRSFTFGRPLIRPGTYDVKLQWKAASGKCQLGDRSLSVTAAPISAQRATTTTTSTPIVVDSSGWKSIGVTDFSSIDPVASLAVTFSGEVTSNRGRLFVRVLVDGEPASPKDVTLIEGGSKWRAASYTFIVKNLTASTRHRVQIQGLADPQTKVQVRVKSLRVLWARRNGSDFVQPFYGSSPRFRRYRLLVIGFDPMRPGHPAPTFDQIRNIFEGEPGIIRNPNSLTHLPVGARGLNVRDWLSENSGGVVTLNEIRYYGCGNPQWYPAPVAHQGNWYWINGAFDVMWREAVEAADVDVNFHGYDADANNNFELEETLVAIVRPQDYPYGTGRGTSAILDNIAPELKMPILDMYLSANDTYRPVSVGVTAHELSHVIFGTMDLYGNCAFIDPGYYDIMDQHYKATHLDPFYKMKNGMVHPEAFEITTQASATVTIPAVERHHHVLLLHDISHVAREYFIIENRWGGTASQPNYDTPLGAGAIVIWQLFEDRTLVQNSAVCPADPRIVRMRGALTTPGQNRELKWADGSPAGIRVTATQPVGEYAEVFIERI